MPRSVLKMSVLLLSLISWAACSAPGPTIISKGGQAPANGQAPTQSSAATSGQVRFQAPSGWVEEQPTSNMRAAQYQLPRAQGDADDASLVVYHFGQGQGGSVQDNLSRWVGQIQQPGGGSSKDKALTETLTVNGLNVTLLDVTGTYTAEMMPGSGTQQNKPDSRMRAAVIETPKGAYFVKLVGPQKTVSRWDQEFMSFIRSFEYR